jgi:hypothetical protein
MCFIAIKYVQIKSEVSTRFCDGQTDGQTESTKTCLPQDVQRNISKPASTGTKNYGQFRGVASFMRLTLQRNVQHGLKKSADIQGEPVL